MREGDALVFQVGVETGLRSMDIKMEGSGKKEGKEKGGERSGGRVGEE